MKTLLRTFFFAFVLASIICHLTVDDQAKAQAEPVNNEQLVSIDFNNVDLVVFIKFMSDLTKKNFVIDDKVKGKVTIISPGKITVKEAYHVFLSVLEVHGYATVPSGKITKIIPSPQARSKSIKTRIEEEAGVIGDNVVTQLIPLRYADPNEIKKLFTPLISKSSVILSYPPTSTLIITDVQSNIKRLMHILKAIDITGVGQQIAIIPVDYADATKLVTLLSSIFKKNRKTKGAEAKDITFVADERTNSIVLLASEGDTDNIRRLIKSLDKETPKGQAKIHVYYLEHANAEDLAKVLLDIPQKETKSKIPGKKTAPVVSDKVRISADKATNSLIIMADMEDYVVLENIIKKIDIPRSMVYIEALIMEVNVTKDFRLGTEYILGGETTLHEKDAIYGGGFSAGVNAGEAGTLATLSAAGVGVALPPGFSLGLFGESIEVGGLTFPSISALVQAYKEDTDVNILSTPQILTTDNQEAKIYVGSNIPFQTQTTNSDSGTALYNSFEYRDVGKTLKITPHISKDRMVRLELSLEVSSVSGTQTTTPTTLKRTVETTAIVEDKNTVVLGGLIDDQMDTTVYKVPCLGEIPLLKYLFSKRSNRNDKTNLYIFLTPRVIQNPDEASRVSKDKRDQINQLREENIKLYHDSSDSKPMEDQPRQSKIESFKYQESKDLASELAPPPQSVPVEETGINARQRSGTDPADDPVPPPRSQIDQRDRQLIRNIGTETSVRNPSFTVQVASVPSVQQADRILQKLIDRGYPAYAVQSGVVDHPQYRVRIGFFENARSTQQLMDRLKSDRYKPILIEF
jgi:general secretion pathway protein D